MCFESPVRGRIHTCRCECTKNTKIIFLSLDVFYYCFECIKVVDLFYRCNYSAFCCEVFVQKSFVVDDTVCFDNVCKTGNRTVFIYQSEIITLKVAVYFAVFQIQTVIFPCSKTYRAIYLEHCRCFCLSHFRLQSRLICTGCCCNNCYFHTCFFCISCCKVFPLFSLFRFEVQVVNFAAFCVNRCCQTTNCHSCCECC